MAEIAPEVIDVPEAARGMEQALVGALVSCFSMNDGGEDKSAQRRHRAIMRRFHAALEAKADRPLYVLEMAEAIGVSIRSLSACCQEHLAMGEVQRRSLHRQYRPRRQDLCC